MTRKFHRLRRFSGALLLAVLIGLPFLRIDGESALRFDVPTLRLFFFGSDIWMADFFIILIAVIFATFLILFTTTIFGRLWCGWLCPQTVLVDATSFVETARKQGAAATISASLAGLSLSAVISASLVGYFVSPYDVPALIRTGGTPAKIAAGSWLVLTLLLFLDLILLRRRFCATVCPYAKMQSVLFDNRTLVVSFDTLRAGECRQCDACVKACPVGIDIKKGLQMACIHCAECVDACAERMAAGRRKSLVNYVFGLPGERGAGMRINPLITGALTAASFVFLIYLTSSRLPFDMNVHRTYTGAPERGAQGSVTNSYELSLRNMGSADLEIFLHADAPGAPSGALRISPATIMLPKGPDILRRPVAMTLSGASVGGDQRSLQVTLTGRAEQIGKSISKTVYFAIPAHQ